MANTNYSYGVLASVGLGEEDVAEGTLTFTGVVADAQLVTIGADIYEFDVSGGVTGSHIAVDVSGGVTAEAATVALIAAINASATEAVTARRGTGTTVIVASDLGKSVGESIITTETATNASWGAETLVGHWSREVVPTQQMPLISHTIDDTQTLNRSTALEGQPMERPPDPGQISVAGDIVVQARYTRNNYLLKHFLGAYDSVTRKYTLAGLRKGMGLTFAIDRQVSVDGYAGNKFSQLVLASTIERVMWTATVIGHHIERPSLLTSQAMLRNLPNSDQNLLQRHLTFWLSDQVDALGSADAFEATGLTLTMARPLDQVFSNQGAYVQEPLDNGFPTFTLVLPVPRDLTNQFKIWQAANTGLQVRAYWTNGTDSFEVLLPSLNMQSDPLPMPGPGVTPVTVTLHASHGLKVYAASTVSAAAGDNSYNDSAASFPYIVPGSQVHVSGMTHPENNKLATVVSWTASKIIVTAATTLVTEAAGSSMIVRLMTPPIIITES